MATQGGRTDSSLKNWCMAAAHRLEFFQAVRLLEGLFPRQAPVGCGSSPRAEAVSFSAGASLAFPAYDIDTIELNGESQARMRVAFFGLFGPQGPLPQHYTAMFLQRWRQKDTTLQDFLDMFHHRLISLFYRAWKKHQIHVAASNRRGDLFARAFLAFAGLAAPEQASQVAMDDSSLIYYAGALARRGSSAAALAGCLRDYFGVPVRLRPFAGRWLAIDAPAWSRLGCGEGNARLGAGAMLGSRVWDLQSQFTIQIGPLGLRAFCDFLPEGKAYGVLHDFVRLFVGLEKDFNVQLILAAAQVPSCRLTAAPQAAPRLGRTSWLKSRPLARDAADVIFAGRPPEKQGPQAPILRTGKTGVPGPAASAPPRPKRGGAAPA